MSQSELLKKVIQVLQAAGIEHMVTGSIVSSLQGEPRSTHDIDIIINVQQSAAIKLARAFPPPDFYLEEEAILEMYKVDLSEEALSVLDDWTKAAKHFAFTSRVLRKLGRFTSQYLGN